MYLSNVKSVALPVPEIIGVGLPKKTWVVRGYAHAACSQKFLMGLCLDGAYESRMDSVNIEIFEQINMDGWTFISVHSFTRS